MRLVSHHIFFILLSLKTRTQPGISQIINICLPRLMNVCGFFRQNLNSHQELKPSSPLFPTHFPILPGAARAQRASSLPPPLLPCSRSSKLQVVAFFAGGGAWTTVSLARDSLTVQEGRVRSTRRRKSAAWDSPAGGTGRLIARARDLEACWDKEGWDNQDVEEGYCGFGQPRRRRRPTEHPPAQWSPNARVAVPPASGLPDPRALARGRRRRTAVAAHRYPSVRFLRVQS